MKYLFPALWLMFLITFTANAQPKKSLSVGDAIPSFSLTDQNGKTFNVANYIGKHACNLLLP